MMIIQSLNLTGAAFCARAALSHCSGPGKLACAFGGRLRRVRKEGDVMDARVFEEWLDAYRRAWEGRDPDAAACLFTEDATYQETPFEEPMRGRAAIRAYWEGVPANQRQIKFESDVLAFTAHGEGLARWRASFVRISSGVLVELDGIFLVRLVEGRCTEFREWWHRREGRVPATRPTDQPSQEQRAEPDSPADRPRG